MPATYNYETITYNDSKDGYFEFKLNIDDSYNDLHKISISNNGIVQLQFLTFGALAPLGDPRTCSESGTAFSMVSVLDENQDFTAKILFNEVFVDQLSKSKLTSKPVVVRNGSVKVLLKIFQNQIGIPQLYAKGSLVENFKEHFLVTDIKLVAQDGEITTKMELLQSRSSVFRAMFDHDSKEKLGKVVEIKDFKKDVLEEFVHFLMNDHITPGTKNALDLLILADKYDIPLLKSMIKKPLYDQVTKDNARAVCKILIKICPEWIEDNFVANIKSLKQ